MSGFVALHREAREHPLFEGDAARFGAWFWLVAGACWKPTRFSVGGATITLQRGQICASRAQLAKAWGWSPSSVERFLTRLEGEEMIEREAGQGRTIITVCNYDKYQDFEEAPGQADNQDTPPKGTRSKTGQAIGQPTGQVGSEVKPCKTGDFRWSADEPGQATEQGPGQPPDSHRTTKEQGNKGTSIEEETNVSPSYASVELDLGNPASRSSAKQKRSAKPQRQSGVDHPLPDNFEPKLGPEARRIVDGWPPGMFRRELFAFRSHAEANGRLAKNWNGAFGTWIAKAEERRITNENRNQADRAGPSRPHVGPRNGSFATPAQRRLAEARSRQAAEEVGRCDDREPGGDRQLPFARTHALPGS